MTARCSVSAPGRADAPIVAAVAEESPSVGGQADGQSSKHDSQVGLHGVAYAVTGRPGLAVVLAAAGGSPAKQS
jgi:hypothetical protein